MEKRFDVLTFGDLCADLIVNGRDIVPEFGQKEKLVDGYSLEMGGSCSIFACQTAKLGLKTVVVGKVGNDQFGNLIINTMKEAGVLIDSITVDSSIKTGISVALNKGDDRAILTYNGTIDTLDMEDINEELLRSVRHLHIGSFYLMKKLQPHYPSILKKIKENGATVSLDTNWDPDETWDGGIRSILPYVDILMPNENEARAITGKQTAEEAIAYLKEIIPIVAVKKGKEGAVVHTGGKVLKVDSLKVDKVDAVGAGDSFDGGFVYGYLSGRNIEESAKIGCICGSLNTRYAGGTKGQPGIDEVMKVAANL